MTQLATPTQVAEYLNVSPETLRQWAHRGKGPTWIKVEGARRYHWSDVQQYIEERTVRNG